MINNREFVVAYLNSETKEEVAKAMNISLQTVSTKAHYLRKKGVRLPKRYRSGSLTTLEISQLNSLINKHNRG